MIKNKDFEREFREMMNFIYIDNCWTSDISDFGSFTIHGFIDCPMYIIKRDDAEFYELWTNSDVYSLLDNLSVDDILSITDGFKNCYNFSYPDDGVMVPFSTDDFPYVVSHLVCFLVNLHVKDKNSHVFEF
jgi:hypothetical protein